MKILGIDPGLGRVGWAVIEKIGSKLTVLGLGLIETAPGALLPRLAEIERQLLEIVEIHQPECMVTEKLIFAANRTTALDVSKALGVILLVAHHKQLPWSEYTPAEIKQSVTGSGNAAKSQVAYMAIRLVGLQEAPKPDDVADALAVALTHGLRATVFHRNK